MHQFHVSLPCRHLEATHNFYTKIIGASVGRKSNLWMDIDLFGHQITFTKCGAYRFDYPNYSFEKTVLPSFHFGVVLPLEQYDVLYQRLSNEDFLFIDTAEFLTGRIGAHKSFFIKDPNGYVIEFKVFKEPGEVFLV